MMKLSKILCVNGEGEYCGKCRSCRELDVWLKEKHVHRMKPLVQEERSVMQSSWPALQEQMKRWGAPQSPIAGMLFPEVRKRILRRAA